MKKSIKLNYVYNLSYQILTLITPLLTAPYIARVLGADGIGEVSFANSIVSYFVLFAVMGTGVYAQREISYNQSNAEQRSVAFWNIIAFRVLSTLIFTMFYGIFIQTQSEKTLYCILLVNFAITITDITWLLQGMEEFGKIVLRNTAIKLLNVVCIFLFVKDENDLYLYVLLGLVLTLLANISLFAFLPQFITKISIKQLHPLKNFKVILSLFIPTIAIQMYTVLDKTMIGVITGSDAQNGFYEQALHISKILLMVVTALGAVVIPRMGHFFSNKEYDKIQIYMKRSYNFVWFLAIPISFGLVAVSSKFVPWFFGDGFLPVIPLLSILGFLALAIGVNNVTGMQYLIPLGKQRLFTITVIMGALVNFGCNLVLIPRYEAIGAAVSSVLAESVIAVVQLILVRKELNIKEILLLSRNYLLAGGIMLGVLLFIGQYLIASIMSTVLIVGLGVVLYFGVLLVLRDLFFIENTKIIINKLRNRRAH